MSDRVYRDPVHGSVAFSWKEDRAIIELIDAREVQRLRRIRQLGAASLVFPGAEHSRFTHSLGAAFLAKRLFDHLALQELFPAEARHLRSVAIAAALLHDIGHGPYSHLFEGVFERRHEDWGAAIVEDRGTDVRRILETHGLLEGVRDLFARKLQPPFTCELISSQLDADRLDYLLRDSYMTGATYGQYDLDWLIEVIELAAIPPSGNLGLAVTYPKGWHVAEQFVIGRHLMYQQVYFHRAIRAAERMIGLIFKRLRSLAERGDFPEFLPAPLRILLQASRGTEAVSTYLELDDHLVNTCIAAWQNDRDPVLAELCRRVMRRDLFKSIELAPAKFVDDTRYTAAFHDLEEQCRNAGFDPEYFLAADSAKDLPYTDLLLSKSGEKAADEIWVSQDGKGRQTLSEISPLIQSIRNTPVVTRRLCFARELQALALKSLGSFVAV